MTERFNPPTERSGATDLYLKWETAGVRTRRLLDRPLTIGRDVGCDICLVERTVSRRHAVVSIVGGRVHIDATTSTNGIKLKEGRTNRATLDVGQSFGIGETTFSVVARPAGQAAAAAAAQPSAALPEAPPFAAPPFAPQPVPPPTFRPPQTAPPIQSGFQPGFQSVAPQRYSAQPQRNLSLAVLGAMCLAAVLALGGAAWYITGFGPSFGSGSDSSDGVGVAPTLRQVDSSWTYTPAVTDGVSVKCPQDWHVDQPIATQVVLREPDSPNDRPVPHIAFAFDQGVSATRPAAVEGMSAPVQTTVAGLQGWEYHQVGFGTPSTATFIDLPYHGGRLQITATRGPAVNLVPQLNEILRTLEVAP